MQDIMHFTLRNHAFLVHKVGKVMSKSGTIDSYCCMNTEMEEVTVSGPFGLSLVFKRGLVGFVQLKKRVVQGSMR